MNKRTIACSTEELTSLSDRANEAIAQGIVIYNRRYMHDMYYIVYIFIRNDSKYVYVLCINLCNDFIKVTI